MSEAEPVPEYLTRAVVIWARYKLILRRSAFVTLAALALALVYFKLSGNPPPARQMIATLAAVGLVIMLGTGLLGIILLKRRGEGAAR